MIQEIANYIKHLKENSPGIFNNIEPSKGIHVFVELDENGSVVNFPGERGTDWDYYDGRNISPFLNNVISYEQEIQRIGKNMNKVFDKKKQIVSCSPFAISFKKEKLENNKIEGEGFSKITNLLPYYFKKSISECLCENDVLLIEKANKFRDLLINNLSKLNILEVYEKMKRDNFINIYIKNISIEKYSDSHNNYLRKNLFNTSDFNSDKIISEKTYGLSNFYNGLNSKKPFLEHKTALFFKGISCRIQAKNTVYLNDFELLLKRKIFPRPMPIFIDKNEFSNNDEILKIFKENDKLTYSQIIKKLFNDNNDKILQNYYLLFFNYKYELEDFDFVSKFRYSMKKNNEYPEVKNLFGLKENKGIKGDYYIKNIFQFESDIVKTIFNNALVKIDSKNNSFSVHYFDEIKAEYVSGGELVYQMILKYRKAFYDYIYKSKTQAINLIMWDEIMWNSILGDVRIDKITDKGFHSKEFSIKEKLNIWFSLYNYFGNKKRRKDMATKIPELLEKMKMVANNNDIHFDSTEEFAFGAGQIIYYLLNQSKASERTHALLEPFIQKVKADQLQNAISRTINMYKHELSFGHGRFERLSTEVLGFDTNENLKKYQRLLLAGYFAKPVIYEKKISEEINE